MTRYFSEVCLAPDDGRRSPPSSARPSIPRPCATSSPAPPDSSARSSSARSSSAGTTRSVGTRSRTTTTRRSRRRTRAGCRSSASTSRRIRPRPRRTTTASSTSPASRASRASAASSPSTCGRTCSRASGCSRRRRARAYACRLRLLVVDLRRRGGISDARGHDPAAALAVRDHEARVRAPRARVRDASSGSTSSPCATSRSTARVSGRTWRSRGWSPASPRGGRSSSTATASQSRSFTYVDDAVEATIAAMERAPGGAIVQRRRRLPRSRCSRRSRRSGGSPARRLEIVRHAAARGRRGPHGGRHEADSRRDSAGSPRHAVRGGPRGSVALGRC